MNRPEKIRVCLKQDGGVRYVPIGNGYDPVLTDVALPPAAAFELFAAGVPAELACSTGGAVYDARGIALTRLHPPAPREEAITGTIDRLKRLGLYDKFSNPPRTDTDAAVTCLSLVQAIQSQPDGGTDDDRAEVRLLHQAVTGEPVAYDPDFRRVVYSHPFQGRQELLVPDLLVKRLGSIGLAFTAVTGLTAVQIDRIEPPATGWPDPK